MTNMTLGIIYAIKKSHKSTHENIIDFMSKYTDTPKENYTKKQLVDLIRNTFIDYLKTCDNPFFTVQKYFDIKRQKETFFDVYPHQKELFERVEYFDFDTYCLVATLSSLQVQKVKDNEIIFVNGFRDFDWESLSA